MTSASTPTSSPYPSLPSWMNSTAIVGLLTLLGAVLRVYHLGFRPLWSDEAVLYWIAQSSGSQVLAENAARNSAPPLFALLLHGVTAIADSDSEAALRFISCAAGIAAIPAIYLLAREFLPRSAAYFCTLLVACARSQVQYSQQVREYSLSFLVAILCLTFAARYAREPNWRNCALLSLFFALGIVTQYGLALLIASVMLVVVLRVFGAKQDAGEQKVRLAQVGTIGVCIVLTVALVYAVSLKQQLAYGASANQFDYVAGGYWDGSPKSMLRLLTRNTYGLFDFAFNPGWLVALLTLVGVFGPKDREQRTAFLLFAAPIALVFVAGCLRKYPYFGARQTIFLTPMIYVAAAFGFLVVTNAVKKPVFTAMLSLFVAAGGLFYAGRYLKTPAQEDIRPLVSALGTRIQPGDAVFVYYGATATFPYYYRKPLELCVLSKKNRAHPETYLAELAPLLKSRKRVWLVFSRDSPTERDSILGFASRTHQTSLLTQDSFSRLYLASK